MKSIPPSDVYAISIIARAKMRDRARLFEVMKDSLKPKTRRYIKTTLLRAPKSG